MENDMSQRSMLDQPKTTWVCSCGAKVFEILVCPNCINTPQSHIIGFKCVGCDTIHTTDIEESTFHEEFENVVH